MRRLVLFDIDGTLLQTAGAGRRAIHEALLAEMGTTGPIDGYRFDGKTDPQIIRELMRAAGHPEADSIAQIERVCERYVGLLERELRSAERTITVLHGVRDLLDDLEQRTDVVLGLLTGNLERGATLKLSFAGLNPSRFRVGAFGSDADERDELPAYAVRRAEPIMGRLPSGEEVVIIGDTPADVTCGASIGARAVAVATGRYTRDELAVAGAACTLDDFSETAEVVQAIVG